MCLRGKDGGLGRRRTDRGHTHGTPVSRAGGDPGRPHPPSAQSFHTRPVALGPHPAPPPAPAGVPTLPCVQGRGVRTTSMAVTNTTGYTGPNVGACVGSASQTGLSLSLLMPPVLPPRPRLPPRPSPALPSAPAPAPVSHHTGRPPSGVQRAPASRRDGVCNTSRCPRSGRRDRWGREVPPSAAPAPLGPRQDPEGTPRGAGAGAAAGALRGRGGRRPVGLGLWNRTRGPLTPRGAAAGHSLSRHARVSPSVDWGRWPCPGGPSEAGERVWAGWGARRWRWDAPVPGPLNGAPGLSWRRSSCKGACSAPVALSICVPGDRPFLGPGKKEPPRRHRLCVCSCPLSSGSLPPFTGIRRPPSRSPDAAGSCLNAGSVGCDRARRFDRKRNFTVVLTEAGNPWECPP